MKVCGKALPPRAALLLTFDFLSFALIAPLLFIAPQLGPESSRSPREIMLSFVRLMITGLTCQAVFYYNELYNLQIVRRPDQLFIRVLRTFAMLFLMLAAACSLLPGLMPVLSRMLLFSLFLALLAIVSRSAALPRRREQVLIIGSGEEASDLQDTIISCPEWNMEIMQISPLNNQSALPSSSDVRSTYDRVIISQNQKASAERMQELLHWKMAGIVIEGAQDFFERATGRVRIDGLTAEQCVFSYNFQNGVDKRSLKRMFDIVAAIVLLSLAAPAMALVALIIWSQRDGEIFFRQVRTGLYGKPFSILKFRSMSPVDITTGPRWAAEETHRISRVGAILRKYRLDELPQLINILRGEMSLVGPRPEQPQFCQLLSDQVPFYEQRHSVSPGLTGWAQVRYHYGSSVEESKRKLEFDLFYVKHLSLWLDCAILIETVKVVIVGRGAL